MFESDLDRVRANVLAAGTWDLLDRVTVYRGGMEPEALEVIEAELRRRGVTAAQQIDHAAQYLQVLHDQDGLVLYCDFCLEYRVPAVWRGWRWYWYLGLVPLFPIRVTLCARHAGLAVPPAPGPGAARPEERRPPGGGADERIQGNQPHPSTASTTQQPR